MPKCLPAVMVLFCVGATPSTRQLSKAGPPASDTQLTVLRGTFDIPSGCRAECRFGIDAYGGAVSCQDSASPLVYGAGIEGMSYESPLEVSDSAVQGSVRIGDATVYWGISKHEWAGFCAIASYPALPSSATLAAHSFCTTAADQQLQSYAIAIVRSFRRADEHTRETCGLFIDK